MSVNPIVIIDLSWSWSSLTVISSVVVDNSAAGRFCRFAKNDFLFVGKRPEILSVLFSVTATMATEIFWYVFWGEAREQNQNIVVWTGVWGKRKITSECTFGWFNS